MHSSVLIGFFVALLAAGVLSNSYITDQTRLYNDIVMRRGYNSKVVPNLNARTPVNVTVGLTLFGIDVDEDKNTLFLNCWLHEVWTDIRLGWKPSKYGNIDQLNVEHYKVFRPDTSLYNSYGPQSMRPGTDQDQLIIDSNGVVMFFRQVGLKSSCEIDPTKDDQSCEFTFGSWVHNALKLNYKLSTGKLDISEMVPHPKWELTGSELKRELKTYACCPEPYVDIKLTLKLRRKVSNRISMAG
ncbi:acetylcholine receptor subunit alpha-type acr-16-like [Lineus longissimus]|uniref:acetylcholine receptor subunit alpha-type acr-16-like n=1 Tax=Lineus longissimus TaxID=88925 RepID=UPI002B4F9BEF